MSDTVQTPQFSDAINPIALDTEKLKEFLNRGGIVSELLDINEEELESIYAVAYNFYQSNRYDEAKQLFQLLCTYNHYESKYFLGLGAIHQAQGNYEEAANIYSAAVDIDVNNPLFPFHAGECQLAMGDLTRAESGFYAASLRSGDMPEYKDLKQKAEGLLALVRKQQSENKEDK